jgi:uncharacterized protein YjiS (DUF1127 family)
MSRSRRSLVAAKSILSALLTAGVYAAAPAAQAAMVTIDFDGLDGGRNVFLERPGNFYNGGLGSFGSGPGPDYGATFLPIDATSNEPRAICIDIPVCNSSVGNALFVFGDEQNDKEHGTILRIDGGFRGTFEFDAAIAAGPGAYVTTRTSLANPSNITIGLIKNPDDNDPCGRLECAFRHYVFDLALDPYTPDDVVAHYIVFSTKRTDSVFIDNIRFHDLILADAPPPPTPIAEPGTLALSAAGIAGLGLCTRRRRKSVLPATQVWPREEEFPMSRIIGTASPSSWTAGAGLDLRIESLVDSVCRAVDIALEWHKRVQERRQLAAMDARMRKDIGITNVDVWHETNKPFWLG